MNKEKKLIPELRFPEFKNDGEWVVKKLEELGSFKNGINKSKNDFGFGVPFVNLMDVFGKPTISNLELGLVNVNHNECELYSLKEGDVLFIRSSVKREGVGETSLVLKDMPNTVYSGFLIRFRNINKDLDLLFKKYCFATRLFRDKLIAKSSTSANTNINQESLATLPLIFPSINEQQKIASCLSSLDELIQAHSQKLEFLKDHKKGLMQNLFPQKGEKVPKFRFPEFKNDGDWVNDVLGNRGEFIGGGTPSRSNPAFWEGDFPWISSSDISEDSIHHIQITRFITNDAIKNSATKIVPENSLLIVSRVGVGKLAISTKEISTSQDFTNFIPEKDNVEFLGYYLKCKKDILLGFSQGMAIKGFTKDDIASLKLSFPNDLQEQHKIASTLCALDNLILAQTEKLDQLNEHKNGLMQRLFPNNI